MSITAPLPAPEPDDVSRGMAELESYVAGQAPSLPAVASAEVELLDLDHAPEVEGETRRVRRLRAEVAEAHKLAALQDDDVPLLLDTPKIRKARRKAHEAARLHQLSQDPAMLAWRDAKVRRTTTVMTMTAAVIALSASSIGVQRSVSEGLGLDEGSPVWWAAFGVEPALSLPLLAAVGVQAYSAMRGRVIDRKSPEGRRLFRTEALLLGLTLVLNCWPALHWTGFDLLPLIVHSLGPVAAVTAIWVLPTLWAVLAALPVPFGGLDHGHGDSASDVRRMHSDAPRDAASDAPRGRSIDGHRTELARLISSGQLTSDASTRQIQTALRCRSEVAQALWRERNGKGGAA